MKDQKKAEAVASERVQLLSPLLAEGIDPAKARELKARICEQTGLSERTLRRYLAKYREEGFAGLKPRGKGRKRQRRRSRRKYWSKPFCFAVRCRVEALRNSFRFSNGKVASGPARSSAAPFRRN